MSKPIASLVGMRFGKLVVILQYIYNLKTRCTCICDCGSYSYASANGLLTGNSKSCGCSRGVSNTVHGCNKRGNRTTEYETWASMIKRCTNPKDKSYPDYGGRGITVCLRWMTFSNFLSDMGYKPNPSMSIDRKENDKGYYPWNCRWATRADQNRNRRGWANV